MHGLIALLLLGLSYGDVRPSPPTGCQPTGYYLEYGDSKTVRAAQAGNNQEMWQYDIGRSLGCSWTSNFNSGSYTTYAQNGWVATNGITVPMRQDIVDADLAAIAETRVKRVLFNLGSNDAFFGLPAEAAWKADLRYILDAFRVKWPTVKVLYSETARTGVEAASDTLAQWYADVAAEAAYSGWVIKCDNERAWWVAMEAILSYDGVHYSFAESRYKAQLAAACLLAN